MIMKPPRNEAIARALALAMDSIGAENGTQLVYKDRAVLDSAPLETLINAENALGVAKSYILKDIDRHIHYIRCCRNRAAPIHQLPTEIFTIIIEAAITYGYPCKPDARRALQVMTVNRIWRDIIINSPQLWTTIHTENPPHVAELFIERSKALPLSLTWHTSRSYDLDTSNKFAALLELVIRNSSRLRSIYVRIGRGSRRTLKRLLGCPTPRLEVLEVEAWYSLRKCPQFAISEGSPLNELTLRYVGLLDWDSRRLSGLRILDLHVPAVRPSINQILHILSTSPFLNKLSLCKLNISAAIHTTRSEESDGEERLIELPHLKTIHIEKVPPLYCASILSRIRPRLCDDVQVEEEWPIGATEMLWEEMWRERGHTMAALLQLSKLSALNLANAWELSIRYVTADGFRIVVKAPEEFQARSCLAFRSIDPYRAIDGLGKFFYSLDIQLPPIRLDIADCPTWTQRQPDLSQWSSVLGTLQVYGTHLVRASCQLLGQQCVMKDGTVTWVCPRLTHVLMCYQSRDIVDNPEMDGMALLLAVQKRWGGGQGIPTAQQPSKFGVTFYAGTLPSIRSRAETIKSIIPCFELTEQH